MSNPITNPKKLTTQSEKQKITPEIKETTVSVVYESPMADEKKTEEWLNQIYDMTDVGEDIIKNLWEMFSYKGFDRMEVLRQVHTIVGNNKRLFIDLVVVTALRGPQAASKIPLTGGKTSIELGILASGGKGTKKLTLNKIQAATADLAAYFLKRMKIPKRVNVDCPAWLQFPSAAAISMPRILKEQHMEFHKRFSVLIGGIFNEQIYLTIEANSYLDPKLNLFDNP
jgi:hypothetical protein